MHLNLFFLLLLLIPRSLSLRPYLLVITNDDIKDSPETPKDSSDKDSSSESSWEDFGDPDDDHDPGSWRPIFESPLTNSSTSTSSDSLTNADIYSSGVRNMIAAAAGGDTGVMENAAAEMEVAAAGGYAHAQSALGFLYGSGIARKQSQGKGFLYHSFAAEGGNMQSKMVMAYAYFRQDVRKFEVF